MSDFCPELFNSAYPIIGVELHGKGVAVVKRKSLLKGECVSPEGREGKEIVRLTARSMSRLVATVNATRVQFRSMITLTYPGVFPREGREIKANMNSLLTMFRDEEWGEYLWFLEFQKRGAPHFHILTEQPGATPRMRLKLAEKWCSMLVGSRWFEIECEAAAIKQDTCVWGIMQRNAKNSYWFTLRSKTWESLSDPEGGKKYATVYATKEYQKSPPKGFQGVGRFWGSSREVELGKGKYIEMTEDRLRMYLRAEGHSTSEWDVLPKYLFNVTGERQE